MAVKGMKVYPLHLGDMWSDSLYSAMGSTIATVAEPHAPHKMLRTPSTCFLIDHPEVGYLLYDTGMPDDPIAAWPDWYHASMKWEKPEETKMLNQLAKVGVKPQDIKYVCSSHLHFDHIGSDYYFADTADFIVAKAEAEHAYRQVMQATQSTEHGYYVRDEVLMPRKSITYLDHDTKDLFPGIDAFIFPGHTPGVLGLLVHLEGGALLLVEDAINVRANLEDGVLPGGAYDTVGYLRSIEKIRQIAKEYSATVIFGHDAEQFGQMKLAPDYYA